MQVRRDGPFKAVVIDNGITYTGIGNSKSEATLAACNYAINSRTNTGYGCYLGPECNYNTSRTVTYCTLINLSSHRRFKEI
jgi:hypothetical protein